MLRLPRDAGFPPLNSPVHPCMAPPDLTSSLCGVAYGLACGIFIFCPLSISMALILLSQYLGVVVRRNSAENSRSRSSVLADLTARGVVTFGSTRRGSRGVRRGAGAPQPGHRCQAGRSSASLHSRHTTQSAVAPNSSMGTPVPQLGQTCQSQRTGAAHCFFRQRAQPGLSSPPLSAVAVPHFGQRTHSVFVGAEHPKSHTNVNQELP